MTVTMALSGYEKQKRWRERHRALYNLQQRNRRANKNLGGAGSPAERFESVAGSTPAEGNFGSNPIQPRSKIEELRKSVANMPKEIPAEPPKPVVYKDDYGRVISEGQWNRLQKMKQEAANNHYEIDDYSQI